MQCSIYTWFKTEHSYACPILSCRGFCTCGTMARSCLWVWRRGRIELLFRLREPLCLSFITCITILDLIGFIIISDLLDRTISHQKLFFPITMCIGDCDLSYYIKTYRIYSCIFQIVLLQISELHLLIFEKKINFKLYCINYICVAHGANCRDCNGFQLISLPYL